MNLKNDIRFQEMCKKHGISLDKGIELLNNKGALGDFKPITMGSLNSKLFNYGDIPFEEMQKRYKDITGTQSETGSGTFGTISEADKDIFVKRHKWYFDKQGITSGSQLNDTAIRGFQSAYNDYFKAKTGRNYFNTADGTSYSIDGQLGEYTYNTPLVEDQGVAGGNEGDNNTSDNTTQSDIEALRMGQIANKVGTPNMGSQFLTPPSSLQPHVLAESNFDRLTPIEVSNQPYIQASNDNLNAIRESLKNIPTGLKSSIMANQIANSEQNLFNQISQNQVRNLTERQRVDTANAGIQMREDLQENANALDFERRQLTAQGKTDADINNYFESLRRQEAGNVNYRNKYNMIQSMYENFGIDANGNIILTQDRKHNGIRTGNQGKVSKRKNVVNGKVLDEYFIEEPVKIAQTSAEIQEAKRQPVSSADIINSNSTRTSQNEQWDWGNHNTPYRPSNAVTPPTQVNIDNMWNGNNPIPNNLIPDPVLKGSDNNQEGGYDISKTYIGDFFNKIFRGDGSASFNNF